MSSWARRPANPRHRLPRRRRRRGGVGCRGGDGIPRRALVHGAAEDAPDAGSIAASADRWSRPIRGVLLEALSTAAARSDIADPPGRRVDGSPGAGTHPRAAPERELGLGLQLGLGLGIPGESDSAGIRRRRSAAVGRHRSPCGPLSHFSSPMFSASRMLRTHHRPCSVGVRGGERVLVGFARKTLRPCRRDPVNLASDGRARPAACPVSCAVDWMDVTIGRGCAPSLRFHRMNARRPRAMRSRVASGEPYD